MSVADRLGLLVVDEDRFVYVAERGDDRVVDAWRLHQPEFLDRLDRCRELILVDPLSFPYERLRSHHRDLPTTVILPVHVPTDTVLAVLARPLFEHLTIHDVVVSDHATWERLRDTYGFVDDQWVDAADDPIAALADNRRRRRTRTVTVAGRDLVVHRDGPAAVDERELGLLDGAVPEGGRVVDVGAGAGTVTVAIAGADPTAHVVAFERHGATLELLAHNVVVHGLEDRVEVVHAQVGEVLGTGPDTDRDALPPPRTIPDRARLRRGVLPLDAWWRRSGHPHVDLLRVGAPSTAVDVLRSGAWLLRSTRPVTSVTTAADPRTAREVVAELERIFAGERGEVVEVAEGPSGLRPLHEAVAGEAPPRVLWVPAGASRRLRERAG